jgi:hypothetical protein
MTLPLFEDAADTTIFSTPVTDWDVDMIEYLMSGYDTRIYNNANVATTVMRLEKLTNKAIVESSKDDRYCYHNALSTVGEGYELYGGICVPIQQLIDIQKLILGEADYSAAPFNPYQHAWNVKDGVVYDTTWDKELSDAHLYFGVQIDPALFTSEHPDEELMGYINDMVHQL